MMQVKNFETVMEGAGEEERSKVRMHEREYVKLAIDTPGAVSL